MALREFLGTLVILCLFGFFKELKPSEPYLTEYLTGEEFKNITKDDVYQKVYPIWSYSYFVLLIPVFLLTDLVRYKPMIMFEGLAYVLTWVILLWAEGVGAMQAMQFVYGMATATEIAYYTYIYAKVPQEDFKRVSSLTRFSVLMGKFVSGLLSQLLDSLDVLDYRDLNYISLAGVGTAFILSLLLPWVKTSIYFHQEKTSEESQSGNLCSKATGLLWSHAKGSYTQNIYNGAIEAITTLCGALIVALVGLIDIPWQKIGDYAILVISILGGVVLAVMSQSNSIWVAYIGYILIRMAYQLLMTVASFELASNIPSDSSGLVFGLNTWVALGLESILTLVVADAAGLALPIRQQFVVYASLYAIVGIVFALVFLIKAFCSSSPTKSIRSNA
eukprot:maker-scaffold1070_size64748-snap-gene-0.13 protein:Tk03036 transcript:maker-scaffold1070_size64748-snap-gene-0.13-mRNA-1 annotation:"hypothetical protein DAPPUDRAFT_59074"